MEKIKIAIAGGSGFAGGELLRLLLFHPNAEIVQITSERFYGKPVTRLHPNLRSFTKMKFCGLADLTECDLLFSCMPHGSAEKNMDNFKEIASTIIDLSADYRLGGRDGFVYGIPELHREEMRTAKYISSAGCNATVTILGLYPIYKKGIALPDSTVVEVKAGSSEGGNKVSEASHHPIRSGVVRSYKPSGHRHVTEVEQELSLSGSVHVHFSVTSIGIIRGALATGHVFLKEELTEKDIWMLYREVYGNEPFIRIVKEREGSYRYPEPKILAGTNFCDIGFEKDARANRLIVISAIDNLMKGAAGQAVQAFNIMYGFAETTGLTFPGLHPV